MLPPAGAAALDGLDPQALNGTDRLRLAVFANARSGHVLLAGVLDNLARARRARRCRTWGLMLAAGGWDLAVKGAVVQAPSNPASTLTALTPMSSTA